MLGKADSYVGNNVGFTDENLISELELSNLIAIATNPQLGVELDEEHLKKLKIILKRVAEEKIDRTLRVIGQQDKYTAKPANMNR